MLRRQGVQVTVYDRYDRAGGLLTYGIPGFKLEKDVVSCSGSRSLRTGGVQFVLNCNVGEDITFDAIRGQHDAVLIATGVYKARDIERRASARAGIVPALDYLTASNRKAFGDEVRGVRQWRTERRGQARGGHRRRRHGDGLRAHGDPPGRAVGQVPLSSRPGEHAGIAARGAERRRGRR